MYLIHEWKDNGKEKPMTCETVLCCIESDAPKHDFKRRFEQAIKLLQKECPGAKITHIGFSVTEEKEVNAFLDSMTEDQEKWFADLECLFYLIAAPAFYPSISLTFTPAIPSRKEDYFFNLLPCDSKQKGKKDNANS